MAETAGVAGSGAERAGLGAAAVAAAAAEARGRGAPGSPTGRAGVVGTGRAAEGWGLGRGQAGAWPGAKGLSRGAGVGGPPVATYEYLDRGGPGEGTGRGVAGANPGHPEPPSGRTLGAMMAVARWLSGHCLTLGVAEAGRDDLCVSSVLVV